MKKLLYFLAAAAVVAVACTKEAVVNTDENSNVTSERYTLFAEMPQFIDDATKASVDGSGVFSWTAGDEINVAFYSTAAATYHYWVLTCTDASTGKFEYLGEGIIPSDYHPHAAYYPKDYTGNPSNQTFDSPAAAAKGFQMEATVSGGKLVFAHENAMMTVTVSNVPSFAKQLVVGEAKVNLSYTSAQASATYYVPVKAAAEAKLSISISDGTNDIIDKTSKNAVEIKAANFYNLPTLAIGPVILIKNSVVSEMTGAGKSWDSITNTNGKIGFHTWNSVKEFTTFNTTTSTLKSVNISGTDYNYYVYPAGTTGDANVIVFNLDSSDGYPRTERTITLPTTSATYELGYGLGLRLSSEKFCYTYHEDSNNGIFVYSWDPEAFGNWTGCLSPTGTSTMWNNGRKVYYYLTNGFTSSSSFNIRSGDSGNAKLGGDNSAEYVNFIDGNCAIGYWSNSGGSGWYSPTTLNEYLQKGPWK